MDHDWRIDAVNGKPVAHERTLPDGRVDPCHKFTCANCDAELLVPTGSYQNPPRKGCSGKKQNP